MGCNESREKELPPVHFTFSLPTPLPLHLYQEYAYPIKKSPTSSGSLSPTSPTALSPTSLSPTAKASPIIKNMATSHHSKLKAIAHYKFPTFKKFPPRVQEQIFNHIEKELQGK